MRIVACCKCVPDGEDIRVRDDRSLDLTQAQFAISRYDLEAIEAALRFAQDGDEVYALTLAGAAVENSKLRKSILSRGPSELFAVHDENADAADSLKTAALLKAAIEKIGKVDLVFCGEGSEDMYCQQVGPVLGMLLGWTTINAVSEISASADGLIVERSLEDCIERLEAPLPALVSVTAGMNTPRIPSMKDILAAGKKPYTRWEAAELEPEAQNSTETFDILAPEMTRRGCEVLKTATDEDIETFYQWLRKAL